MKKHGVILLCGLAALSAIARYDGLSGNYLAEAVRSDYASPRPAATDFRAPAWMLPDEVVLPLVPAEWWMDDVPADLYNIVRGPAAFAALRLDYPPAPLDETIASGEGWEIGIGLSTNAWQPADDRRGDLARRMMYMALMYPQLQWHGRGIIVFEDNGWPLLSAAGAKTYLAWHREDPADERELAEMASIENVQGNRNPFIDLPELAEYLWGDQAGMGYIPPSAEKERVPLRGHYSRSSGESIDLYSPHVPSEAQWSLDGEPIGCDNIDPATLSVGNHELQFSAPGVKGKITISVEP